ncbi:TonB-dependent receptor [Bowmanella sp. Y26]|uniref:TonB-dependent receptor n=1 Tax=Bowmanella yangjiangensis TaxID=2811230 RepID=UPI001BDC5B31|nr:TonB-dependent receptor [Bowmanella yangjiangensis]MBT1063278.1 TonB-dependent receptor [Bowmanella yangjiangensis]
MKTMNKALVGLAVQAALLSAPLMAQEESAKKETNTLEKIEVTAQKRTQSIQEVPISIAALSGERLQAIFSAGDDVQALANRIPGLYAESSNGRVAPRFYIRGLGNSDFDLAASQPVSIIMDDVVMENVILKSFPLFDVQRVEVIRGPQGSLFGRNTTAGIVKFDTAKPGQSFDAFVKAAGGTYGTLNFEGAVGNAINDEWSFRLSGLSQNRNDWIANDFTGEEDAMGGFHENAGRLQLLYENNDFSALLNLHTRDLDGTASIFRANAVSTGSNDLNSSYDRDRVSYDKGDNNFQKYRSHGASLKMEKGFDGFSLTSITAYETADGKGKGDIDGGVAGVGPGFIPFDAVTEDQLDDLKQFTQELRIASEGTRGYDWQFGAFFFDSSFGVTSIDGLFGATTVYHDNYTWAVFGQGSYDLSEQLSLTGGLRYTYDEKDFSVGAQNVGGACLFLDFNGDGITECQIQNYQDINVDDGQLSWELALNYNLTDSTSLFSRLASGFRAQTIQGRNVAFEGAPTTADAETITSFEVGMKSDLLDNTLRLNVALFYYEIDDIQISAIGGEAQGNSLLNADSGEGKGFEIDLEYLATDNLTLTAGYGYSDTELQDDDQTVAPCGSGQCTVLDPMVNGQALIDGNPFPQSPKQIVNFTARYAVPMGDDGEFFVFTDWAFQGKTNLFLYDAVEFRTKDNFEGGLRIGYENFSHDFTVALFGRNITDEDNIKGAVDFNNNTVFVNEPRIVGVEFKMNFY